MKRSLVLGCTFLFAACGSSGMYNKRNLSESGGIASPPSQQNTATDQTTAGPIAPPQEQGDSLVPVSNPFVSTAYEAVSTFGADVDTASYEYFRGAIRGGFLPSAEQVRLEDFVNYFAYDYPVPEAGDQPFSITATAARNGMGRQTSLLRIGIRTPAKQDEQNAPKKPVNLVFLQDVSGSMSGPGRLGLCQTMERSALDVLDPTDRVAIVTYAGSVGVRLASTPVSDKQTILTAINGLSSGGGTAGAAGITLAYQQASDNFMQDGINHVVLCTDGDFNVGASSDDDLLALIKSKRDSGITLTAVGVGYGNYNDGMMEKVSNAGNGIHAYLTDEQQASDYATKKLIGTIMHIAKDVKLQVEFNKTKVQAYRLLGYENRVLNNEDFRNDKIDAGEIGTDHRVTALYELILSDEQMPQPEGAPAMRSGDPVAYQAEIDPNDLALVKVRFKKPTETDADAAREVHVAVSAVADAMTDADFQFAAAVAGFAEILRGSPYAVRSQIGAIDAVFAAQASRDDDRGELHALFTSARSLLGL